MNKIWVIIAIAAALGLVVAVVVGVLTKEEIVGCTLETKICPDGSSVGRNFDNNCRFDLCPPDVFPPKRVPSFVTIDEV